MENNLKIFENIVRAAKIHTRTPTVLPADTNNLHPFDERNIHPDISEVAIYLFDDGHFSQSTFEAFKYIDQTIKAISNIDKHGVSLMMEAFKERNPKIQLTNLSSQSEIDEQKGFSFLFSGSISAIRNPRGHEIGNIDSVERCLDHLSLASFLLRRLKDRVSPCPPA